MMMARRRHVISSLMFGGALVAIIGISEATLEPPEPYGDRFCLLDDGHQTCGFATLALCMKSITGAEAECVREAADDKNADRAGRHEH
ncbi:DUF3551 domain-containing protein [Bradyrhizobium sp. CCGE-LA001]|jgi:hypothetical protein|uniref:DUF3551 domain-containing protein n=1 Tax=Bradyrhizobium sp. CCGE-LA001 TaxID=1223566 RepID=UPI0011982530|nr:DUF3551 domain-containing protein [Bradyrhizobium sp. CCGE-LA001]